MSESRSESTKSGGNEVGHETDRNINRSASSPRRKPPRLQAARSQDDEEFNNIGSSDSAVAPPTERTSLLSSWHTSHTQPQGDRSPSLMSRHIPGANSSLASPRQTRNHSRRPSMSWRHSAISSPLFTRSGLRTPRTPRLYQSMMGGSSSEDRVWYDQFTSTDWVRDSIADGHRVLELRKRKDFRGRLLTMFDASQGWILVAIIGCLTAAVAYFVDIVEGSLFDIKRGYCKSAWYLGRNKCCKGLHVCSDWRTWSDIVYPGQQKNIIVNWAGFTFGCVLLAVISCYLTLFTKTVVPSNIASTFDEDLGARRIDTGDTSTDQKSSPVLAPEDSVHPPMTYYSAAGSGVAEVKVILSGFVLHRYLGVKTLIVKTLALILSVASGMSLGKEGPYVHIATCIGNIACRLFPKYNLNDGKRREVLSASAASGVAVAFGSPLGGVLFSLEEVSYYFPPKTLFRTFFCCIVAALSLKFLNPYGTNKIVLFEVRYVTDWRVFELVCFAFVGIVGGLTGALFIKASRFWATTFRRIPTIKKWPMLEVLLVALVTGLLSYWNRYANLAVAELLFELASPCNSDNTSGLCPSSPDDIIMIIRYLLFALLIKSFLTVITFGIKVPAGIYVPSMVVGGIMGRIIGHTVQYVALQFPGHCPATDHLEHCITPGVYALVAAGATMCGVTRLSVTLAVILFELTGSLDHVLPFSLGVLCAKWTADFIEPHSIYDLLIDMNSYPFIDNRGTPVFDTELGDITPRVRSGRIINISLSPFVRASELRSNLKSLQDAGELDGGLPIVRDKALVGLIPAPDLEFALDQLEGPEDETLCLMANVNHGPPQYREWWLDQTNEDRVAEEDENASNADSDATSVRRTDIDNRMPAHVDFTPYIDPAPVALDIHSPMDLVYQCFAKLGLRYVCVVESGEYRGMVHKKVLVRYIREHGGSGH